MLKPLQKSGISHCPLGWHSVGELTAVFMADVPKTLAKMPVSLLLVVSPAYLIALIACSFVLCYLQRTLSHHSISHYCKLTPLSRFIKVSDLQA